VSSRPDLILLSVDHDASAWCCEECTLDHGTQRFTIAKLESIEHCPQKLMSPAVFEGS
jgi:hypothetical protein